MVDSAKPETFSERLDYALKVCDLSNREFAARVDPERGQQIVNNWRKRGRIGWPSVAEVNAIFGGRIDMLWLNDGAGQPLVFRDQARAPAALGVNRGYSSEYNDLQDGGLESVEPIEPNPASDKASQPERISAPRLTLAVRFLERQFALWGREFNATERTHLIAAVYDRLADPETSNLVSLSQWLATQMKAEDSNVGTGEAGSAGRIDRARAQGGA